MLLSNAEGVRQSVGAKAITLGRLSKMILEILPDECELILHRYLL